jgi:phenylpyruvate tautomerase PptA (4-oxalocrotonate tautomerase family)
MPHVIVKLAAGRTEPQKAGIAEAVTRATLYKKPGDHPR